MLSWKGWRRLKVRRSEYVVYGRGGGEYGRRIEVMDGWMDGWLEGVKG